MEAYVVLRMAGMCYCKVPGTWERRELAWRWRRGFSSCFGRGCQEGKKGRLGCQRRLVLRMERERFWVLGTYIHCTQGWERCECHGAGLYFLFLSWMVRKALKAWWSSTGERLWVLGT